MLRSVGASNVQAGSNAERRSPSSVGECGSPELRLKLEKDLHAQHDIFREKEHSALFLSKPRRVSDERMRPSHAFSHPGKLALRDL